MTQMPDQPPPRRAAVRGRPRMAWVAIVLAVALLVWLQAQAEPAPVDPDAPPNPELVAVGRVTVALERMLPTRPDAPNPVSADVLRSLARPPVADHEAVALVVLEAESAGRDAALARIDNLRRGAGGDLLADLDALETLYRQGPEAITDAQRDALLQRRTWFGRLALTHGLDADDPQRQAVLAQASRTLAGMTAVLAGVGLGLLAGLALLVVAIVALAVGKIRRAYRPSRRTPTGVFLETVAVFLVAWIGLTVLSAVIEARLGVRLSPAVPLLLVLTLFWPLARGVGWAAFARGMGLSRGRGILREMGAGIVGYVAGLPILAVGFVLTLLLIHYTGLAPEHPVQRELADPEPLMAIGMLLLALVWAPIVEELVFRGAFYHHMRRAAGVLVSALVVGFFFAVIHPQGVAGVPVLMSIALVLALIREWRGSILGAVTAHFVHNGLIALLLVLIVW